MTARSGTPVLHSVATRAVLVGLTLAISGCVVATSAPRVAMHSKLQAAASCKGTLGAEYDQTIDPARPNPALAAEAVQFFTNKQRCSRGLKPLGIAAAAVRASEGHARTMARHGTFDHTSPDGETFPRRLGRVGARFRIAAENLARTPFFSVGSQPYVVRNAARCQFATVDTGRAIPQHSYRMLGARLVDMWMASSKHRDNLLSTRFQAMGAGIAVSQRKDRCGHVSASSTFLG